MLKKKFKIIDNGSTYTLTAHSKYGGQYVEVVVSNDKNFAETMNIANKLDCSYSVVKN